MKLSTIVLSATTIEASNDWVRPSYTDFHKRLRYDQPLQIHKEKPSNVRNLAHCDMSDPFVQENDDPNLQGIYCGSGSHPDVSDDVSADSCVALCKPGYQIVGKYRSKCLTRTKKGVLTGRWNKDLRQVRCVTCQDKPPKDDLHIQKQCTPAAERPSMNTCTYTCTNGAGLFHPQLKENKMRNNKTIKCKCDRKTGACAWNFGKDADGNRKTANTGVNFKCGDEPIQGNDKYDKEIVKSCSDKLAAGVQECTSFLTHIERYNSWDCKHCYRMRIQYNMAALGIEDFDAKDYLDMRFDQPVAFDQEGLQYPIKTAVRVNEQYNVYRLTFYENAQWGNGNMDATITVRGLDDAMRELIILGADSCPCSNKKGAPLSMVTKPTRAPVPGRDVNTPEERQCAVKNNEKCSWIRASIEEYDHYDCRACFRVNFSYEFGDHGIKKFNSEDYLMLKYDQEVFYQSGASEMVSGAEVFKLKKGMMFIHSYGLHHEHLLNIRTKDGSYVTQINFADGAHLEHGVDMTLTFRYADLTQAQGQPTLKWAKSCPCQQFEPSDFELLQSNP